jgi:hypothetical protein
VLVTPRAGAGELRARGLAGRLPRATAPARPRTWRGAGERRDGRVPTVQLRGDAAEAVSAPAGAGGDAGATLSAGAGSRSCRGRLPSMELLAALGPPPFSSALSWLAAGALGVGWLPARRSPSSTLAPPGPPPAAASARSWRGCRVGLGGARRVPRPAGPGHASASGSRGAGRPGRRPLCCPAAGSHPLAEVGSARAGAPARRAAGRLARRAGAPVPHPRPGSAGRLLPAPGPRAVASRAGRDRHRGWRRSLVPVVDGAPGLGAVLLRPSGPAGYATRRAGAGSTTPWSWRRRAARWPRPSGTSTGIASGRSGWRSRHRPASLRARRARLR